MKLEICNNCKYLYFGECAFGALKNVISNNKYGADQICIKRKTWKEDPRGYKIVRDVVYVKA